MRTLVDVLAVLTPFLVAVDVLLTRVGLRRVKRAHEDVQDLKNGGLKDNFKEALKEHREERDNHV